MCLWGLVIDWGVRVCVLGGVIPCRMEHVSGTMKTSYLVNNIAGFTERKTESPSGAGREEDNLLS